MTSQCSFMSLLLRAIVTPTCGMDVGNVHTAVCVKSVQQASAYLQLKLGPRGGRLLNIQAVRLWYPLVTVKAGLETLQLFHRAVSLPAGYMPRVH